MRRLMVVCVLAVLAAGCGLSPGQSAALDRYEKAVAEVRDRLGSYAKKAEEIAAAIREKRMPLQEGLAVLSEIRAGYEDDAQKLGELTESIGDIRKQEVPWYYYLGPIVTALLGLVGGRVPGWRTERVLGAVIEGVEKTEDLNVKESIRDAAELRGVGPELHRVVRRMA